MNDQTNDATAVVETPYQQIVTAADFGYLREQLVAQLLPFCGGDPSLVIERAKVLEAYITTGA